MRRALARVAAGEIYMHPALAMKVIRLEADGHGVLTQRESEVLRLVALGWTSAEIAGELFISPRTVDTHRARINEKLGFASRRELVAYAIEHDLIAS